MSALASPPVHPTCAHASPPSLARDPIPPPSNIITPSSHHPIDPHARFIIAPYKRAALPVPPSLLAALLVCCCPFFCGAPLATISGHLSRPIYISPLLAPYLSTPIAARARPCSPPPPSGPSPLTPLRPLAPSLSPSPSVLLPSCFRLPSPVTRTPTHVRVSAPRAPIKLHSPERARARSAPVLVARERGTHTHSPPSVPRRAPLSCRRLYALALPTRAVITPLCDTTASRASPSPARARTSRNSIARASLPHPEASSTARRVGRVWALCAGRASESMRCVESSRTLKPRIRDGRFWDLGLDDERRLCGLAVTAGATARLVEGRRRLGGCGLGEGRCRDRRQHPPRIARANSMSDGSARLASPIGVASARAAVLTLMRTTARRRLGRVPVTYSSLQDKPEWQGRSASDLPAGSLWRQARPFASRASDPRGWGLSGSVWTLERRVDAVGFRSPWWILSRH
ncbi:hypothetical protein HETIRDRAFT_451506 [Heterobasidion irregulare TC 32-1]|uniref:Uncharacterized protein n=1 Tax=Heterobasidion irregulare (strain TC 32-1) TaxID=747525 RepID=W4K8Z3_HETIT|nr:uncharacterized protein HETIRDRAFT_451506 [Heterobasidion irregulare TC 32-1]ETW81800.1 hypothetical protein HETIRDRAFT_451506 [Heterobasidion irregulare TC 32-1]